MPSSQSLGSGVQGPALVIQLNHGRTRTPNRLTAKALGARVQGGTRRPRRKAKGHRLREEAPLSSEGGASLCAG